MTSKTFYPGMLLSTALLFATPSFGQQPSPTTGQQSAHAPEHAVHSAHALNSENLADSSVASLTSAAEQGDSAAQFELGSRYLNGKGVRASNFEALHWFKLAAEQNNNNAQYNLAVMHLHGLGVIADQQEAVAWFTRAAENGDPPAQFALGVAYANGSYGLRQDIVQSWIWLSLAGNAGHRNAAANAVLLQELMSAEQLQQAQQQALTLMEKF